MRSTPALALLPCLLALGACQSSGDVTSTEGRSPAPVSAGPEPTGLGVGYRPAATWKDESEGVQATFVYVSATGSKTKPRPFPIIYSSDPANTYFYRENSPKMTVRRVERAEMVLFLASLERDGMHSLPWEDYGFHDPIGGERAFYLYRDGSCRRVAKVGLTDALKVTFTHIENRIIALNHTY